MHATRPDNAKPRATDTQSAIQAGLALLSTPLGALEIRANDQGLLAVGFTEVDKRPELARERHQQLTLDPASHAAPVQVLHLTAATAAQRRLLENCCQQLAEYFAGHRMQFDLPLAPAGTEFQRSVWQGLCRIPYGQTQSYGQLAASLGKVKAMRAVGSANGRNPIAIIVPCHRVIGADGRLTGYAGGLTRKVWLLQHEQQQPDR